MESYVGVSMPYNTATILLLFLITSYTYVQPSPIRKMLVYVLALSTPGCLLFFSGFWPFLMLKEVVFFFWQFRFCAKSRMMVQRVRALWYMTFFAFYQGGFHNSLWFVPLHASVYWPWLAYGGMLLLFHAKWRDMLACMNYLYRLHIRLADTTLHLKGWLDSGNLLNYEGIPVLFISSSHKTYFRKQDIELVVTNTADDTSVIHCYACLAAIEGCHKHRILVRYRNHVSLPLDYEVLLNINIMTLG